MADETTVDQSPPKKKSKLFKVLILIILGLAAIVALVLFLKGPGLKKVTDMSSQVLRMKMPAPKTPSKTLRKPIEKVKKKTAPKRSKPKVAAPSKTTKPVKLAKRAKVAATAKAASAPVKSSVPPGEINYKFEMKRVNGLLQQDAKNAEALYNRGWLHEKGGNLISAEKNYSEAIKINRKLEDAYFNRGLIYIETKKYDKAARDFTEVIKMKPRTVDAYCNRGNAYFKLGKRNFALRDYKTALGMDPNDADIYFNRALVHLNKGDKPKAMADFRKAANLGLDRASQYLKPPAAKPKAIRSAPSRTPSKIPVKTAAKPTASKPKAILQKEKPSAGSASGRIRGVNFKVEEAGIANGILTLRQGSDFFPDHAILIFLFLKEGEKVDNRTFDITKGQGFGSPHIHMKWKQKGQNAPKTEIFMKDYTMSLKFGKRENGTLPGKISLSLPDKNRSYVKGTFFAKIK